MIPTLPTGGQLAITVVATLPSSGSSADISGSIAPPAGVDETNPGTNATNTATALGAQLNLTKTVSPVTGSATNAQNWTITIANTGAVPIVSPTVSDLLFTSGFSTTTWEQPSCVSAGGATCPSLSAGSGGTSSSAWVLYELALPTLPAGGSLVLTYQSTHVDERPVCGDLYTVLNSVTVRLLDGSQVDRAAYTNIPGVPACPALTVGKSVEAPTPRGLDAPYSWTITYTNDRMRH